MTQLGKVGRDYIFAKRKCREQGSSGGSKPPRNASEASTNVSPPANPNDGGDEQSRATRDKGAKNGAKFGNRS